MWLIGYIDCSYADLVKVFGEPTAERDGYKVDVEWEFDNKISIYNWKDGKNYLGDDGMEVEDITDWHIGGTTKTHVIRIVDALKEAGVNVRWRFA
jgi:hypothetical protein